MYIFVYMTTLQSSSAAAVAESSMEEPDDTSQTLTKSPVNQRTKSNKKNRRHSRRMNKRDIAVARGDFVNEECDDEAWETLSKSFRDVQSVLDRNRALIQQVNENHHSKIPDNLVQNVSLIREINGNISKVMNIYSDLSVNFSNIVHQRRAVTPSTSKSSGNNNGAASTES